MCTQQLPLALTLHCTGSCFHGRHCGSQAFVPAVEGADLVFPRPGPAVDRTMAPRAEARGCPELCPPGTTGHCLKVRAAGPT